MGIRYLNKNETFEVAEKPPRRKAGYQGGAKRSGFTEAQIETLQFWRDFQSAHGFPPSIREAAEHFGGLSSYAITCRCKYIIKKGAMKMAGSEDQSRRVLLTSLGRSLTRGNVAGIAPRPLYIQTAHGFVGAVTQERKCECGRSYFTDNALCAECARGNEAVK